MRNQGWLQDGTLVKDDELYLDDGVLKVRDIQGVVREPTEAETKQFYWKPEPSELELRVNEMEAKMIVSEPPVGMTKIKNLYKDPETDEMVGEDESE